MAGFFVQLLLSMAAIGLAIPVLVAAFLVKGLRRVGLEEFDLARAFRITCSASVTSFLLVILVAFLLPHDLSQSSGFLVNFITIIAGQLILVPILVRQFTARVLAVEAGSILLGNLIVMMTLYQLSEMVPR